MAWEVNAMVFLQGLFKNAQWFFKVQSFISMFGEELIMVGILGLLFWGLDKKFGEYVGFSVLSANVFNSLLKNIVKRNRPYMDNPQIENHKPIASGDIHDPLVQGYSFPSGHSQGAGALYSALAIYGKKKWLTVIAIVIPLLVAISRVFLGVHYPTDVLVGLALGVGFSFGMYFLLKAVKNKYVVYIVTCIVAAAGLFYAKSTDYFTSYGMLIGFVVGIWFEDRFVKFENTRCWWRIALRVVAGAGIFLGIGTALKPLFNLISLDNNYLRVVRYAITTFVCIGIYPMLFKVFNKLWLKLGWVKQPQAPSVVENNAETNK